MKKNQTGYTGEFIVFFQKTLNADIIFGTLKMMRNENIVFTESRVRFLRAGQPKYEVEDNTITVKLDKGLGFSYQFTTEAIESIKDEKGEILWQAPSE